MKKSRDPYEIWQLFAERADRNFEDYRTLDKYVSVLTPGYFDKVSFLVERSGHDNFKRYYVTGPLDFETEVDVYAISIKAKRKSSDVYRYTILPNSLERRAVDFPAERKVSETERVIPNSFARLLVEYFEEEEEDEAI